MPRASRGSRDKPSRPHIPLTKGRIRGRKRKRAVNNSRVLSSNIPRVYRG
jgi:hypothetical protein